MALLTLSRNDKRLVDLPTSWSNKNRREQLQREAAESFSNLVALAVAKSNTNFQLYDALRPIEEQKAIFFDRYRRSNWSAKRNKSDRWYQGKVWRKVKGANAAAPGMSNHGSGLAVDIHPGPIQEIFKSDGPAWGWSWAEGRKNGESWHFVYIGGNRYASRGWLDHAWVQKVVGAKVDGKIGTGTVAKIKAYQKEHGLEADGIVGPGTKKVMQGKGDASPAPSVPATPGGGTSVPAPQPVPSELVIEQAGPAKNAYGGRTYDGVDYEIKHVTIHWWGRPSGQTFEGIRDYLIDNDRSVSAHYVVSGPRVAQILPEERGAWGNGNRKTHLEGIVIECDPNRVEETIPTLVALLSNIFRRRGKLDVYPHDRWTSTECPGEYRQHIPEIVAAAKSGKPVIIKETTPSASEGLPTGKDLLMKLADVPDFPLLRTPGHLCYYGDASGPIESVSGKNTNSLHPGEIYTEGGKTRSRGIVTLQKRLVKRGYAVDVDGRWGAQMDNAIDNLQRLAGVKRDKKVGPVTWYAAWLLPVK